MSNQLSFNVAFLVILLLKDHQTLLIITPNPELDLLILHKLIPSCSLSSAAHFSLAQVLHLSKIILLVLILEAFSKISRKGPLKTLWPLTGTLRFSKCWKCDHRNQSLYSVNRNCPIDFQLLNLNLLTCFSDDKFTCWPGDDTHNCHRDHIHSLYFHINTHTHTSYIFTLASFLMLPPTPAEKPFLDTLVLILVRLQYPTKLPSSLKTSSDPLLSP